MSTGDLTIGTEQTDALISYPELICINKNIEMMKVESKIISNERPTEFRMVYETNKYFYIGCQIIDNNISWFVKIIDTVYHLGNSNEADILLSVFFKGQDLIEEMKLMLEKEKVDDDLESLTILRKKYPKPTWI